MQTATERIESSASTVEIDPATLDEVPEDDRALVQNVLYAIMACKHPDRLCTSWSVSVTNTQYVVSAMLPENDWDVSLVDLELIQSVSPLRIVGTSIICQNGRGKLMVKVLNGKQRVQLTEGDLIVTQKKRRIMLG